MKINNANNVVILRKNNAVVATLMIHDGVKFLSKVIKLLL